jgi:hypothetical protein
MTSSTGRTLAIIFAALGLLISVFAIFNKSYVLGISGSIICLGLFYFAVSTRIELQKIPLPEVIEKIYRPTMESGFRISVPRDFNMFHNEERGENYVAILHVEDKEEGTEQYFPFEANMYTGELGRGVGSVFDNVTQAEFWANKEVKGINIESITNKIADKTLDKLKQEIELVRGKGGNNGEEGQQRTPGG